MDYLGELLWITIYFG